MRLQQQVYDANYHKLLEWITTFKELDLPRVSANTPTHHIMDSIKNIDTVYEAWIFLEFVEYLYEKGVLVDFRLGKKRYCQFVHEGKLVTFWYEKIFPEDGPHAWARTHTPDFTAMVGETIVAIFDAKNYAESSITEPINKMLAYMANLDSNFGALIFPNDPKYWDDFDKGEKVEKVLSILSKDRRDKEHDELKKIARAIARLPIDQLPDEYKERWAPRHFLAYSYPKADEKARYHLNQKLSLFRMSPVSTKMAIDFRNKSLESIFTEDHLQA